MSAVVTIAFADGVASSDQVRIAVSGAVVALALNEGVSAGMGSFPAISVLSDGIAFATLSGSTFSGTLTFALDLGGQDPAVTLQGLVPAPHGQPATLHWPTAEGTETQILTPGVPLVLNGIAAG